MNFICCNYERTRSAAFVVTCVFTFVVGLQAAIVSLFGKLNLALVRIYLMFDGCRLLLMNLMFVIIFFSFGLASRSLIVSLMTENIFGFLEL